MSKKKKKKNNYLHPPSLIYRGGVPVIIPMRYKDF